MNSRNTTILILFILLLVLLYQLYFTFETFSASRKVYYPISLDEIQQVLRENPQTPLKTVGNQTSNNKLRSTKGIAISTKNLTRIINVGENTVTAEAGITLLALARELEKHELALPNLPSNQQQTLGGAISIAAHGSNLLSGTMSDCVKSMVVVLSNGNIRRVDFDDPEFPAFVTNIGMLGTVYTITLECVNMYNLTKKVDTIDWKDIKSVEYRTTLELDPKSLSCRRTIYTKCGQDAGVPYYQAVADERHTQCVSVAVPFNKFVSAVNDVIPLLRPDTKITIDFTGPDYNSWLSPSAGRQSAWIKITGNQNSKVEDILVYKYGGRPDWANTEHTKPLHLVYGTSLDYCRKVQQKFDANNLYSNETISKIFY